MKKSSIPYYSMPINQAKALESNGLIIRGDMGTIELTKKGEELLFGDPLKRKK
jgi:predicted transcriptional regulator